MLDPRKIKEILEKAAGITDGYEIELTATFRTESLARFAESKITQHVDQQEVDLVFRVQDGRRQGRAGCNQFDEASIRRTVEKAVRMAEAQRDRAELLPLLGPQTYRDLDHYVDRTVKLSPAEKTQWIARAAAECRKQKVRAAGIFSTGSQTVALANTKGLSAIGRFSSASFSLTAMTADSSGWAEATRRDVAAIHPEDIARIAAEKANRSRRPREAKPGRYTVVLEPAAVAELLLFMAWEGFGALPYLEGRSFLSGKMGRPLLSHSITISDDVYHPQTIGLPFDYEGTPRRRVPLIEKGIARGVVYDRKTAKKGGASSTGHSLPQPNSFGPLPMNIVMSGGESSVEQMIARTGRGLLVTHFHYTNLIDPVPLTITGMTRNGTFLIEKGRIRHPVKNLRFTESVVESFSRVAAVGRDPVYASSFWEGGIVAPAMAIRDFNFSSSTTF